jgi:hypothetical protein
MDARMQLSFPRIVVVAAILGSVSPALADPVRVWTAAVPGTSHAEVIIDASPAQLYDAITAYARWDRLFSDARGARLVGGGSRDGRVDLYSRVAERRVQLQFDNRPDRIIRFKLVRPTGATARGDVWLTPLGIGRTRVQARLYAQVSGLPGLLVGEATLRQKREAKLRSDLTSLQRRFPSRAPRLTAPAAPTPATASAAAAGAR